MLAEQNRIRENRRCRKVFVDVGTALFLPVNTRKQKTAFSYFHPVFLSHLQKLLLEVWKKKACWLSVIVMPPHPLQKKKKREERRCFLKFSNSLTILHTSRLLLSGGFERVRKKEGGVNRESSLSRTISAERQTEERGEITGTCQTRCWYCGALIFNRLGAVLLCLAFHLYGVC